MGRISSPAAKPCISSYLALTLSKTRIWPKKRVLLQAVEKAGLDPVEAGKVIDERSFSDQVDEAWKRARQFQVTGVPSFISGSYATTGYHPYEELAKFIEYVEMQKARGGLKIG